MAELEDLYNRIALEVDAAISKLADESVIRIKQSISTPYPPASLPFTPPHMRTGELYESIQRDDVENHSVEVFSDCSYAPFLEYGTSKMAPRTFIEPEAEILDDEIEEAISAILEEIL